MILEEQDIKDLKRYRKIYAETGDRYILKAIEYLESGKKSRNKKSTPERSAQYKAIHRNARRIIKKMKAGGSTFPQIMNALKFSHGLSVLKRVFYGSNQVSLKALKEIVQNYRKLKLSKNENGN